MVYSTNTLNKMIMSMLLEGSNFLIKHSKRFETHVDEFIRRASRLPRQAVKYLHALIRLKAELQSRGPFIKMIENDLYRKQLEVKRLIDEGLDLKQSMITLVLSLTNFLHEETMADMHRKTEIKGHIQENILELLKKNRIHQTTKMRMRAAARGMSQLMDQMEVVEESKEIIEEVWAEAVEAANCM
jgi:hypothetical protein